MRAFAIAALALLAGCTQADDDTRTDPAPPGDGPLAAGPWPVEWGAEDAPIRPGAPIGFCTWNFLFYDDMGPNGTRYYIGTAGHCTDAVGDSMPLAGFGDIGKVVYDSDVTAGADPAVDFSLVELDEGLNLQANPRMVNHGGPRGSVEAADLARGDMVELHGYGLVLGDSEATRDRQGILTDFDERLYRADMPAVNGDSGSPLLHGPTGKALGIVSHYGIGAVPPATDEGPLMPFIMAELEKAGFPVKLATV